MTSALRICGGGGGGVDSGPDRAKGDRGKERQRGGDERQIKFALK